MKKSIKLIFIGLIALQQSFGQTLQTSGWQWQNPQPAGGAIKYIHFQNEKLGWAGTTDGALLRTSNGGNSWSTTQLHDFQGNFRINSLKIFENGKGMFIQTNRTFTTTNRGKNWFTASGSLSGFIVAGHILTDQIAWAHTWTSVSKTTNGGQSWQEIAPNLTSGAQSINCLKFINPNIGWVVANGGLIKKTTDGGFTWNNQNSGVSQNLFDLVFIDENLGWACGSSGRIIKTTNGGSTWATQTSGQIENCLAIAFLNQNIGLAAGNGFILKTTNGGSNWSPATVPPGIIVSSLTWVSPNICMAGGSSGSTILRSTDAGNTWQLVYNASRSTTFYSVKTAGSLIGALGAGGLGLRSTDNGTTWADFLTEPAQSKLAFAGQNMSTWLGAGNGGIISRSTNSGATWAPVVSGTSQQLNDVHFFPGGQKGYAVGDGGTIRTSGDAGATWAGPTLVAPTTTLRFNAVYAVSNQVAYAAGDGGIMYKTTNGGTLWGALSSTTTNHLRSVVFSDINTGWIAGDNQTLIKTTNGGNTWTSLIPTGSTSASNFNKVDFLSATLGLVSDGAFCYFTSNGGNTWTQVRMFEQTNDAYFSDQNTVFAVGNYGQIIKTTRAGAPCTLWATIASEDTISLCGSETKTLSANVNETGTYQWFKDDVPLTASTAQSLSVSTPGDYHIRVTAAGCTSITHAVHVRQVSIPAAPAISAVGTAGFCPGGSATLSSTGGAPVLWYRNGSLIPGTPISQINVNQAGSYTARVTAQACSSSASAPVVVSALPAPNITIQPVSQNLSPGSNAVFQVQVQQPSATFQWQSDVTGTGFQNLNNVLQYSGVSTNTLTVSNVSVANNNQPFRCIVQLGNCKDTSSVATIFVVTAIRPAESDVIGLFPNPGNAELNLVGLNEMAEIALFDALGRNILRQTVVTGKPVSVAHLPQGVYSWKLRVQGKLYVGKWMKIN